MKTLKSLHVFVPNDEKPEEGCLWCGRRESAHLTKEEVIERDRLVAQ